MLANIHFVVVAVLIIMGLYAMLFKRNLIKIAMGLSIMASGINLFLISLGYREHGIAPIFTNAAIKASEAQVKMVMPAPQALTLTSIVISLAVTALMLSFAILIFRYRNSMDSVKARGLKDDFHY
jgi:multicomponent Na+:H+ antiporter subunit C